MKLNERLNILDIWVDPIDRHEAITRVAGFLRKGKKPHTVFAANPEKNFSIPNDPTLYETFKNADILLPDGIGMVLAARILFGVRLKRLPGSEFVFDICELAAKEGYGIFIYGAKDKINKMAKEKLEKKFPGLKVVGRSSGYVKQSGMHELIDCINSSHAKILFVALGSPKQENWFAKYQHDLKNIKVCQCIGGTLDTIAGNVKRAPKIWQKLYLEWLYRLITQPKRIKRQKVIPLFALEILKMKLKHRHI